MSVLDLAVTASAWLVCYYVRFYGGLLGLRDGDIPPLVDIIDVLFITLLLTVLVFGRLGMYKPRRMQSIGLELFDIVRACLIVWAIEISLSLFLHSSIVSRKLQGLFLVVWPIMLMSYRATMRLVLRALRRRGLNLRTVAVVGAGRLGQKLVHAIRSQPWTGYEVLYFIEDHRVGGQMLGLPIRGPVADIEQVLAEHPVDSVMIALPQERSSQLADVLNRLSTSVIDINIVPDLLSHQFLRHRVHQIGMLSIVNLTHSPQSGWPAVNKRAIDIVLSCLALVFLSPLMLAIALAVKLSSKGPVFYLQRRASLGGEEFDIIKFRSMVADAEGQRGPVWATPNDPRATGVGKWLRRFSLDELPQLLNVLRGDMSLVGPRPERPELIERFSRQVPRYMLRHHVKAGITGWAQVNGFRGMTSLRKRIQYDLDYINRWSPGFDLYILAMTVLRGFISKD